MYLLSFTFLISLFLIAPTGELACAIYATLDVYGVDVDVIVSHNGQEEDWPDRKLQTEVLSSVCYLQRVLPTLLHYLFR